METLTCRCVYNVILSEIVFSLHQIKNIDACAMGIYVFSPAGFKRVYSLHAPGTWCLQGGVFFFL